MNGAPAIAPPQAVAVAANKGGSSTPEMLNAMRIGIVADRLAESDKLRDDKSFYQLCLSLASELDMMLGDAVQISEDYQGGERAHVERGIDYGVANNDFPDTASKLPPVLKQVCHRKNQSFVQAAIMVLMISVKNACKMGWFSLTDTEELLTLAKEVGSGFGSMGELNSEAESYRPAVSSIMSRFYPQLKLNRILTSLEVKPGYGTYAIDFHIPKNIPHGPDEKIRLFVASKDNMDTSSCIISPQQANILLNGKGVEKRTNVLMDAGPQPPTVVNHLLKFGTNLLQAVGQFNGHYIIVVAFMDGVPASALPVPQDYVEHDFPALGSGSDPEIIEGPSRISLNCPISYRRIETPVKGHLCKHYQCFDLGNYIGINSKRPSWRCPHCNRSVCFTDLRIDQNMVKVLKDVGENVSEVIISADGSWTAASSDKDESRDKTLDNQQGGREPQDSSANADVSDAPTIDLTQDDDEMDIVDRFEPADTKPVINRNFQSQPIPTNTTSLPISRSTNDINQHSPAQFPYNSSSYGSASFNVRPEAQNVVGISGGLNHFGVSPVLTDAVSSALSRQSDSFQGTNYMTSSTSLGQFTASASQNLQLQDMLRRQVGHMIPRNVSRSPSAIQALPVQTHTPSQQQHLRPALSMPAANGSPVPFQAPVPSNAPMVNAVGGNTERQQHYPFNVSNVAATPVQNRSASQVMGGLSTTSHNFNRMPHTLSQPPHLMRSSQVPRGHAQQGVSPSGLNYSPSTVQRVELTSQQIGQMRPHQTPPLQRQPIRMPSTSLPSNAGNMNMPQAVSRTENLIDVQSEQNWRPAGRMRGALQGPAYSAALNQFMGLSPQQTQAPITRPSTVVPPSLPDIQILLANRMAASQLQNQPMTAQTASQPQNQPRTDVGSVSGAANTQLMGPGVGN